MENVPDENVIEKGTLTGVKGLIVKLFGIIFLILGLIGAILPVMPSIPFLLISTACFFKTSPKLHKWMLTNRLFGKQLRRYHYKEGLPLYVKLLTVLLIIGSFALTLIFFIPTRFIWLRLTMLVLASAYSVHILLQPGVK